MSQTRTTRTACAAAVLTLAGALLAGSTEPRAAEPFGIESCSLGCTGGPTTVSCGIVDTFVNQELAFDFSQAVDLSSVFPGSFRIFNTLTGVAPIGKFRLDGDRSRLVFEPALFFDPQGNPSFGFESGASYQLLAPGTLAGDPPPYVLSYAGQPNETRLLCTITASQGVADYVPGPPSYAASVEVVPTCTPGGATHSADAVGARCVSVDSSLTLVFDDVMNLGTLVVPATGNAPFVQVRLAGTGAPIPGSWSFSYDTLAKTTTVVFTPAAPLPPLTKVEVVVPPQVLDLVGNPHTGPALFAFLTEGA